AAARRAPGRPATTRVRRSTRRRCRWRRCASPRAAPRPPPRPRARRRRCPGARLEAAGRRPTSRSPGTAWTGTYHDEPKGTKRLDSRTTGLDSHRPMPLSEASQPLYHRVYREISKEISSGALQPGDRLPSERWLCDELGVSRATVRRAIEELTADGLVEGRGRGSFVTSDALAEPAGTL